MAKAYNSLNGWEDCAAKIARESKNVMPSAEAGTQTINGVTAVCDGKGRYIFTGTASGVAKFIFPLSSQFTIPTSVGQGGTGTLSFFNTRAFSGESGTLSFLFDETTVDGWSLTPANRVTDTYKTLSGKDCNKIVIQFANGVTTNVTIAPMFTNDGVLPTNYEPYSTIWEPCGEYVRRNGVWVQQTAPALSQQSLSPQMSLDVQPIQSPSQTMGADEPIALETDVTDNSGGGNI